MCMFSSLGILEALVYLMDSVFVFLCENFNWFHMPDCSTSSALAKLKGAAGGASKQPQGEKKETPQERLKRIMSKQLNKQSMTYVCIFIGLWSCFYLP